MTHTAEILAARKAAARTRVAEYLAAREKYANEAGQPSARKCLGDRVAYKDPSRTLCTPAVHGAEPYGRASLLASDLYLLAEIEEPACAHGFPYRPETREVKDAAECVGCGMTWCEYQVQQAAGREACGGVAQQDDAGRSAP